MVQGKIPEHDLSAVYEPMINLILAGSKTMTVGTQTHRYDPATYFVMSVDLPAVGVVRAARDGTPYLGVSLTLDPAVVAALLLDLPPGPDRATAGNAFAVGPVTAELLDAWVRMLRLMDRPDEIPALAPAYEREILFRVLQGPMGWMVRDLALPDSALARVGVAIRFLRENATAPLRVEELARMAALSASAFHRQFKAATALSPLQYQKRIRLLRARAKLRSGEGNATSVAFDVGYQSPNQFTREYARFFGAPPSRDVPQRRRRT